MLEEWIRFNARDSIVKDLTKEQPQPSRIFRALKIFISLTYLMSFVRAFSQILMKSQPITPFLITFLATVILLTLAYAVSLYALKSLYYANGGDSGKDFIERVLFLSIGAGFRIIIVTAPVILFLSLFTRFFAHSSFKAINLSLAFTFLAISTASLLWSYFYIKNGLLVIQAKIRNNNY